MRVRDTISAAVVLAAVATACSGASVNHAGGMGHSGGASSQKPGRSVQVEMKDLSFSPDHLSVKRGETVKFRFVNVGKVLHEAVIGDEAAQTQAEQDMQHGGHQRMQMGDVVEVKPGETGELVHTFDKDGEVLIGCHQPGHYAAGMKATVSVAT